MTNTIPAATTPDHEHSYVLTDHNPYVPICRFPACGHTLSPMPSVDDDYDEYDDEDGDEYDSHESHDHDENVADRIERARAEWAYRTMNRIRYSAAKYAKKQAKILKSSSYHELQTEIDRLTTGITTLHQDSGALITHWCSNFGGSNEPSHDPNAPHSCTECGPETPWPCPTRKLVNF